MDNSGQLIGAILEYFYPPKCTSREEVCATIADALGVSEFKKSDVHQLVEEQQRQVLELLQAAYPENREEIIELVVEEEVHLHGSSPLSNRARR